jgi:hypothetical protein
MKLKKMQRGRKDILLKVKNKILLLNKKINAFLKIIIFLF